MLLVVIQLGTVIVNSLQSCGAFPYVGAGGEGIFHYTLQQSKILTDYTGLHPIHFMFSYLLKIWKHHLRRVQTKCTELHAHLKMNYQDQAAMLHVLMDEHVASMQRRVKTDFKAGRTAGTHETICRSWRRWKLSHRRCTVFCDRGFEERCSVYCSAPMVADQVVFCTDDGQLTLIGGSQMGYRQWRGLFTAKPVSLERKKCKERGRVEALQSIWMVSKSGTTFLDLNIDGFYGFIIFIVYCLLSGLTKLLLLLFGGAVWFARIFTHENLFEKSSLFLKTKR